MFSKSFFFGGGGGGGGGEDLMTDSSVCFLIIGLFCPFLLLCQMFTYILEME